MWRCGEKGKTGGLRAVKETLEGEVDRISCVPDKCIFAVSPRLQNEWPEFGSSVWGAPEKRKRGKRGVRLLEVWPRAWARPGSCLRKVAERGRS